jgi:magnesium chelatase family protein
LHDKAVSVSGTSYAQVGEMKIYAPLNYEPTPMLQTIEVATLFQLPSFQIIGLPAPEVAEAKERVRSAIDASGYEFPRKRVIVNLSPASIRKRGTGIDLAIALSILSIEKSDPRVKVGAWGELGLLGEVKPIGQITRAVFAAWKENITHFLISRDEMKAALQSVQLIQKSSCFQGPPPILVPVSHLKDAWSSVHSSFHHRTKQKEDQLDLDWVAGPTMHPCSTLMRLAPSLERMIGVAVAGQHHLLLLGPRGSGKSHALEWFTELQPVVSSNDQLNHQLLSELCSTHRSISESVPVRRVGAQVRPAALVGGVTPSSLRPGEFSLASGGVLIADEFPEWPKDSREAFREPLERGKITLTRARATVEFPAQFVLAASGNLCPCGGWPKKFPDLPSRVDSWTCKCSETVQRMYLSRLSGPILDRIDMMVLVSSIHRPSSDAEMNAGLILKLKEKVRAVRVQLVEKWGKPPGLLHGTELEEIVKKYPSWHPQLARYSQGSLRDRHKLLRIALTLSAWDSRDHSLPAPEPTQAHWIEARYARSDQLSQ